VITVVYTASIPAEINVNAASDAAAADWFDINQLPLLAFDHAKIVKLACDKIKKIKGA